MMNELAQRGTYAPYDWEAYLPLLTLLGNPDPTIHKTAVHALCHITNIPEDGDIVNVLAAIFDSGDITMIKAALCTLYKFLQLAAVTDIVCCVRLVSLARSHIEALNILVTVSATSVGSDAVIEAGGLRLFPELILSDKPDMLELACLLLANISQAEKLHPAVIEFAPCPELCSLLSHLHPSVRQAAQHALHHIIKRSQNWWTVLETLTDWI
ncbi:armadillo-type protein [Mycena crocata]|nr:armadillo-type protein [Mycena crocata]